MNSNQLGSVAFVFLGVVALIFSVGILQALIAIPFYTEEFGVNPALIVVAYVFPFLLLLVSGTLMILKRHRLAQWVNPESESAPMPEQPAGLSALLFAVVGIYLVVSTLSDLGSLTGQLITLRAWPGIGDQPSVFWSNVGHYLGTLAEFVIGGYLFLNARGIGRWWNSRKELQERETVAEPTLPQCPQCSTPFDPTEYQSTISEKRCSKCRAVLPASEFSNA